MEPASSGYSHPPCSFSPSTSSEKASQEDILVILCQLKEDETGAVELINNIPSEKLATISDSEDFSLLEIALEEPSSKVIAEALVARLPIDNLTSDILVDLAKEIEKMTPVIKALFQRWESAGLFIANCTEALSSTKTATKLLESRKFTETFREQLTPLIKNFPEICF